MTRDEMERLFAFLSEAHARRSIAHARRSLEFDNLKEAQERTLRKIDKLKEARERTSREIDKLKEARELRLREIDTLKDAQERTAVNIDKYSEERREGFAKTREMFDELILSNEVTKDLANQVAAELKKTIDRALRTKSK
jgi:formate-dependent nitrite reductase cytochrome c552 subunit